MSLDEFYLWESLLVLLTRPADPPPSALVDCFAVIQDTVICVTVKTSKTGNWGDENNITCKCLYFILIFPRMLRF